MDKQENINEKSIQNQLEKKTPVTKLDNRVKTKVTKKIIIRTLQTQKVKVSKITNLSKNY